MDELLGDAAHPADEVQVLLGVEALVEVVLLEREAHLLERPAPVGAAFDLLHTMHQITH